ncbi:MAG: hypothetical protein QXJ14_04250 [Candidatus Aenigmatarchaeota archaeon]
MKITRLQMSLICEQLILKVPLSSEVKTPLRPSLANIFAERYSTDILLNLLANHRNNLEFVHSLIKAPFTNSQTM